MTTTKKVKASTVWADHINKVMRRRSKKLIKKDMENGIKALIRLAPLLIPTPSSRKTLKKK